jgi:dihydrolipoamide dehydrogenase
VEEAYDLVVIGAGPGGYVAAVRAAQLGMRVAVVEREKVGGVCLHKGCIPSKTLLKSAEVFDTVRCAGDYGILTGEAKVDLIRIQERKRGIVSRLHKGVQYLLRKHNIEVYHGTGRIMGASIFSPQTGVVTVEQSDGKGGVLKPKHLIIATGSRPRELKGVTADGNHILYSDHMLELDRLPDSVVIVGGGAIGVEWASMLSDFGVRVTIVESADRILPFEDEDISREMTRLLQKRGVQLLTQTNVQPESVTVEQGAVSLHIGCGGERQKLTAERVLLSVGREANVDDIGLSNTDIQVVNGFIEVNEWMQTSEPHVYAIGDVVGGYQLAHVASREGVIAVEHMAGLNPEPLNPRFVPRCTYSRPEVASVGLSEQEASALGYATKTGNISFRSMSKALVHGDADGFVKIVADAETDDVLGVHMIGSRVTDLISEAGLARLLDATPWELSQVVRPHPSLSEALGEAALDVEGASIHGA